MDIEQTEAKFYFFTHETIYSYFIMPVSLGTDFCPRSGDRNDNGRSQFP